MQLAARATLGLVRDARAAGLAPLATLAGRDGHLLDGCKVTKLQSYKVDTRDGHLLGGCKVTKLKSYKVTKSTLETDTCSTGASDERLMSHGSFIAERTW